MVVDFYRHTIKRRGRPLKHKPAVDSGTPEHQIQRNSLLSLLNSQPGISSFTLANALGGSILHQLFCLGRIDHEQLQIGLSCKKLFSLAARSMGIHTRLTSISRRWGEIRVCEKDMFESKSVEKKWKKLREGLFKLKLTCPIKNKIINLILFDEHLSCNFLQPTSSDFVDCLQSILDEIGKMMNKLGSKNLKQIKLQDGFG